MNVHDVMTQGAITIDRDATVVRAVRLMLQNRISGLPVVDETGQIVGIVTEGDFLRRGELGTQRRRRRWIEFLIGPGSLADEYVHACGRKVDEIMTPHPLTISATAPLEEAVQLMERRRIKRLPVVEGGKPIGIVSRANLLRAFATSAAHQMKSAAGDDATIRSRIMAEYEKQPWAPSVNVQVHDGTAELHGVITDERQRRAFIVAAENVPGVKAVHDHLVWMEPTSGMVLLSEADERKESTHAS
jgi:CBS domain-containing protein